MFVLLVKQEEQFQAALFLLKKYKQSITNNIFNRITFFIFHVDLFIRFHCSGWLKKIQSTPFIILQIAFGEKQIRRIAFFKNTF